MGIWAAAVAERDIKVVIVVAAVAFVAGALGYLAVHQATKPAVQVVAGGTRQGLLPREAQPGASGPAAS